MRIQHSVTAFEMVYRVYPHSVYTLTPEAAFSMMLMYISMAALEKPLPNRRHKSAIVAHASVTSILRLSETYAVIGEEEKSTQAISPILIFVSICEASSPFPLWLHSNYAIITKPLTNTRNFFRHSSF